METEIKGSRNYSATVIRVPELRKAQNSDRLYIIDKIGITAIVDDSWLDKVGELAILFPAEVQLSQGFASWNNLFRHSELNQDSSREGYLEDSRRVRALKLRGNISNGLVLPITSLGSLPNSEATEAALHMLLSEGDVFDTFMGNEICRKYVIETKGESLTRGERQQAKVFRRVDTTYLPEHFETGQWMREKHNVPDSEPLIITQKLHGTSVRLANTVVKRQLKWYEKIAQRLGVEVADHGYDLVAGSRKAIKDPNNPNQAHFYGSDIWTDALKKYQDAIPKNFVVYGELIGYIPGSNTPIQKGHTYDLAVGEYEMYVYRVAVITEGADLVDLSWNQVKAFCQRHGLKTVPELIRCRKGLLYLPALEEVDFWKVYRKDLVEGNIHVTYNEPPVRLSPGGTGSDEGVAIRVESGLVPEFYKFKNKSHYLFETSELDKGKADLESQG